MNSIFCIGKNDLHKSVIFFFLQPISYLNIGFFNVNAKNWNMTKHFPQELNMNFLHKYDM